MGGSHPTGMHSCCLVVSSHVAKRFMILMYLCSVQNFFTANFQVLCIPAMQPYINKYVDRAMSQNQKPTKPVSDASKGYDSPQAMTSTKDTKTTDMPTSPVPQPTETVNAIKGEMLKRTYSLDSLKSKCSPPPGSQQSPDRSVIDSPATTVKFVGARNDGKGFSVVRPGLAVKRGHVPVLEKENVSL